MQRPEFILSFLELLPAYIIVFLNFLIGFFVFSKDRRSKLHQVFCLLSVCVGVWALSLTLFQVYGTIFLPRITYAFASFIPAFFFAFSVFFPHKDNVIKIDRRIFYVCSFFVACLSLTGLIVSKVVFLPWGVTLELGPLYIFFALYFMLGILTGLINLFLKYCRVSGQQKIQIKYVFVGTLVSALLGAVVAIIFPLFGYSRLYYLAPPGTLIMIGFFAYAIVKHRLMDISVIISRTVAEILTIAFHSIIYLALVWLYRSRVSSSIDALFLLGTIIMGIVVGQAHHHLRVFIQTTSDKLFLRGKYDYYKELAGASSRVGQTLSLSAILKILYETFGNVIEVSRPQIFLPEHFLNPEKPSAKYVVFDKATALPKAHGETISLVDPLIKKLILSRQPLLDPQNPERELMVPCLLEDRLIAVFVLGKKLSEDSYTDEDLGLLGVLANQAAMALDHTRSYEKIKSDLETTERQLARSERIASMASLIQEYNHEIRTPLTIMNSKIMSLPDDPKEIGDFKSIKEYLQKQIDRAADIVDSTLRLSRPKEHAEKPLNINDVIDESLRLYQPIGITVTRDFAPLPQTRGDFDDLKIVFINLVKNAREAIKDKGSITVKTSLVKEEGGDFILAEVSDTGEGIKEQNLKKIFEPFFSTHVTKGRGLGLSIVFRVVREHLGTISVESKEGEGTTFVLKFPVIK